ncbi:MULTISPECIES: hypothetical protein [Proteiniphilum]|uniref:hypothetical protein n=1 Tax=Proteiniphilum TaxID=294702 RepID=UPI0012FA8DE4|nr:MULTISPECIES: hypothetical protein [Proteiniphilum]
MQAIEFNSFVRDGAIPIPEQYRTKITSAVRVIVFSEDNAQHDRKRKRFTAMKLRTKDFVFNREEANER